MTYRFPEKGAHIDPAPNTPTLEEIQLAEEIRHRLKLRLLPSVAARPRQVGAEEYDWGIRYEL